MNLTRSIREPIRSGAEWSDLWEGEDLGLIACWERGREKAVEAPDLAALAVAGNLPVLPWKGGYAKPIKAGGKYGTFNYLAMWQGLRGEDLRIATDHEMSLTCAATGMRTVFTADQQKFASTEDAEE